VTLSSLASLLCLSGVAFAQNAPSGFGHLAGIVSDPTGIRQMGATVLLTPEGLGDHTPSQLLTDQNGSFMALHLRPGLYSAKVSLAGFLPSLQEHIRITPNLTTMVHFELGSLFASLDSLRREPAHPVAEDDWQWVLRTSSTTRPVLHLLDDDDKDDATVAISTGSDDDQDAAQRLQRPRARIEMASGSLHAGSSSGLAGPPATAVSYDQSIGGAGRVMMAGRMSYTQDLGAGATFAGIWLPAGEFNKGPETVVVLRQARFDGSDGNGIFRSLRASHSETLTIGNTQVDYGIAYLTAGSGDMSTSLRPRFRVSNKLAPGWSLAASAETEPDSQALRARGVALQSALDALDTLPVIIWKNGQGRIAGAWHYELNLRRDVGKHGSIEAAEFRDSSGHVAIFGFDLDDPTGPVAPPIAPYAHDGGRSSSWGSRVVYKEKVNDNLEVAAIYSWAGVLAPQFDRVASLSDAFSTVMRHSVAGRIAALVPGAHTKIAASYKWLDGTAVSRQDIFAEAALGIDPYFSFSVKQPLPSFRTSGHWEAMADFRNVLSQGYVPLEEADGRHVLVAPIMRSFRGGVSFQF